MGDTLAWGVAGEIICTGLVPEELFEELELWVEGISALIWLFWNSSVFDGVFLGKFFLEHDVSEISVTWSVTRGNFSENI